MGPSIGTRCIALNTLLMISKGFGSFYEGSKGEKSDACSITTTTSMSQNTGYAAIGQYEAVVYPSRGGLCWG